MWHTSATFAQICETGSSVASALQRLALMEYCGVPVALALTPPPTNQTLLMPAAARDQACVVGGMCYVTARIS